LETGVTDPGYKAQAAPDLPIIYHPGRRLLNLEWCAHFLDLGSLLLELCGGCGESICIPVICGKLSLC